jgi:hypothetical protein
MRLCSRTHRRTELVQMVGAANEAESPIAVVAAVALHDALRCRWCVLRRFRSPSCERRLMTRRSSRPRLIASIAGSTWIFAL